MHWTKVNEKEDYHIHANYNDHSSHDLTVSNIIKRAEELSITKIAITEHVRKTSDWIENYIQEIENIKPSTKITVLTGFESKILKDGDIDCPIEYRNNFIIASFHTKFNDKSTWINALKEAIKNPDVNVIGHIAPEETFTLDSREVKDLACLIKDHNKIVELNAKYHRPPKEWLKIFLETGIKFHLGSDAHRLEDIGNFSRITDLIELVERYPNYVDV